MDADMTFWEDEHLYPRTRSGRLRPSLAYRRRRARWLTGAAASLVLAASAVTAAVMPAHSFRAPPAAAPVRAVLASATLGDAILDSAESRTGDWYSWAGAGPSVFDCSGLVVWAAARHGISIPHSTYLMVSSPHLYRVYSPRRGDLAFFGTGHVEFVTIWYHTTFGAHHSGTRVGWSHYDPRYYGPTAFYRIR
jgi:cell wall-associated NlpC family hydrolase